MMSDPTLPISSRKPGEGVLSVNKMINNKNDHTEEFNNLSIENLKHLRKEKDKILKTATIKLAQNGHISTNYPPMWMDAPSLIDRLPRLLSNVLCTASIAGMIWATSHQMTIDQPSMSVVVTLISIFPFVVGFAAYNICCFYPLEYIERLNFLAIALINTGAVINLVFGRSYFVVIDGINEAVWSFVGTTALSVGTLIFSFCTMVLGPWEFMAGAPLLSIGLLLRNCALYFAAFTNLETVDGSISDIPVRLNIISVPFVFIALSFFVKRAYQLMRLPVLGSHNYRFFGVLFYGGSILSNATLSIIQQTTNSIAINSASYRMVISITSTLAFFGTSIFLLDGSRVKHHYDAMLEDRFPSTTNLVRFEGGMKFAGKITPILVSVQFALIFIHLVKTRLSLANIGSPTSGTSAATGGYAELAMEIFIAISLLVLCAYAFYPSLQDAIKKKEKKETKIIQMLISGLSMFIMGNFSSAILKSVIPDLDLTSNTVFQIPKCISAVGAFILIISAWPSNVRSKISFHPSSWENVLAPCNYVLLAAIWLFVGEIFKATSYYALGALSHSWAYCVLMFHFSMAYYVWESTNLEPFPAEDEDRTIKEDSSSSGSSSAFGTQDDPVMEYDVLISGGGISGLFLACILGKQDLRVAICK